MTPLNLSIIITGILFIAGRIIYLLIKSHTQVVKIEVQQYDGLPDMIFGKNKFDETIDCVQVQGNKIMSLGKMLVTIKNSQIISIAKVYGKKVPKEEFYGVSNVQEALRNKIPITEGDFRKFPLTEKEAFKK